MCEKGDLTQCTKLNEHANKINGNGVSYDKNKHPYFVPLNQIIPDITGLDPLLLATIGNNVSFNDLQERLNTKYMKNSNKYLENFVLSKVYPNKDTDLNDIMTFSNAKAAYCMKRKDKTGDFYIPSIYGQINENGEINNKLPVYKPNEKIGSDILLTSLITQKHKIELSKINFGNNPFNLGKGDDNDEYYCNRFMPVYCQNIIQYLKNKLPDDAYTQKELLEFAPQCACYGHSVSEYLLSDPNIKLDSNSISTLKGIPKVCSLEGCGKNSYHPDETEKCENSYNIQVCNNAMNFDKNDLQAGKDILIDSYNNCTQNTGTSSIGDLKQEKNTDKKNNEETEKEKSDDNTDKKNNEETEKEESDDTDNITNDNEEDNETNDSNDESEEDNETPKKNTNSKSKPNNTSTNQNNASTDTKENSNKTLYIILAIIAVIVVILIIIIIIVVSKNKSTSGGAPHIADFGHLIRSSKK